MLAIVDSVMIWRVRPDSSGAGPMASIFLPVQGRSVWIEDGDMVLVQDPARYIRGWW